MAQRLGVASTPPQGTAPPAAASAQGRSLSSAAFTAGWRAGLSRYQRNQLTAQIKPKAPSGRKATRQPQRSRHKVTSGGASAAPPLIPAKKMPCADARSEKGIHCAKAREMLGDAPASAAPNRKRIASSDRRFQAVAVRTVNTDHRTTMAARTRRAPKRSPSQPAGT